MNKFLVVLIVLLIICLLTGTSYYSTEDSKTTDMSYAVTMQTRV